MVKTRHSLTASDANPQPSTSTSADVDQHPSSGVDGKPRAVSRALKKLQIDGNLALKGDRDAITTSKPTTRVYHWRGAVYEIQENTPQEWIEAQPKRYREYERSQDETEHDENPQDTSPRLRKRRKVDHNSEPIHSHVLGKRKRSDSKTEQKGGNDEASQAILNKNSPRSRRHVITKPPQTTTPRSRVPRSDIDEHPHRAQGRSGEPRKLHTNLNKQRQPPWLSSDRKVTTSVAQLTTRSIARGFSKFLTTQKRLMTVKRQYSQACSLHERAKAHSNKPRISHSTRTELPVAEDTRVQSVQVEHVFPTSDDHDVPTGSIIAPDTSPKARYHSDNPNNHDLQRPAVTAFALPSGQRRTESPESQSHAQYTRYSSDDRNLGQRTDLDPGSGLPFVDETPSQSSQNDADLPTSTKIVTSQPSREPSVGLDAHYITDAGEQMMNLRSPADILQSPRHNNSFAHDVSLDLTMSRPAINRSPPNESAIDGINEILATSDNALAKESRIQRELDLVQNWERHPFPDD